MIISIHDPEDIVLTVTRLATTPNAVTKTMTYELTFNQVATVTDPLSHTTTFGYDARGNLLTVTDAKSQQTVYTYSNINGRRPEKIPCSIPKPTTTTTMGTSPRSRIARVR